MLKTTNLYAGYVKNTVLKDINCHFKKGTLTAIVGPNGSGKSTLLKSLIKLVNVSDGNVFVDGTDTDKLNTIELAKKISYLPQNKQIPEISVLRMVLHGRFPYLNYPRHYRDIDYTEARKALKHVALSDYENHNMCSLSGGTQQKVFIAMTLAQNTPVILMDEPLSFLDISHQINLMELAHDLTRQGKTVVMVIHDLLLAMKYCDEIIVLNNGEIVKYGNTDEIYNSKILDEVFDIRLLRFENKDEMYYYYE